MKARRIDTAVIIFGIICLAAVATWVLPAGTFQKETIEVPGAGLREVVVPGTFEYLPDSTPQGPLDVLRSPIRGLIAAVDVIAALVGQIAQEKTRNDRRRRKLKGLEPERMGLNDVTAAIRSFRFERLARSVKG